LTICHKRPDSWFFPSLEQRHCFLFFSFAYGAMAGSKPPSIKSIFQQCPYFLIVFHAKITTDSTNNAITLPLPPSANAKTRKSGFGSEQSTSYLSRTCGVAFTVTTYFSRRACALLGIQAASLFPIQRSGASKSRHWTWRCPLPPGVKLDNRCAPQLDQVVVQRPCDNFAATQNTRPSN